MASPAHKRGPGSPFSPEKGGAWDSLQVDVFDDEATLLVNWVNKKLSTYSFLSSSSDILAIKSLSELDAKQLTRVADHVLQQLESAEDWRCLCHHSNPGRATRCEKCTRVRAYVQPRTRRQGAAQTGAPATNGSGSRTDRSVADGDGSRNGASGVNGRGPRSGTRDGRGAATEDSGCSGRSSPRLIKRLSSFSMKTRHQNEAAIWKKLCEVDQRQQPHGMAARPAALESESALARSLSGGNLELLRGLLRYLQEIDEGSAAKLGAAATPTGAYGFRNPMLVARGGNGSGG
ncbi:unnamed protein product, partial [Phaeothamnion confervicola]